MRGLVVEHHLRCWDKGKVSISVKQGNVAVTHSRNGSPPCLSQITPFFPEFCPKSITHSTSTAAGIKFLRFFQLAGGEAGEGSLVNTSFPHSISRVCTWICAPMKVRKGPKWILWLQLGRNSAHRTLGRSPWAKLWGQESTGQIIGRPNLRWKYWIFS